MLAPQDAGKVCSIETKPLEKKHIFYNTSLSAVEKIQKMQLSCPSIEI